MTEGQKGNAAEERAGSPAHSRPPASGEARTALANRKRALSIHQKLLALIALLIVGVVGSLAVYFPARHIAAMQAALEAKASMYARLASKQLEPAVAFDDQQTAREVFESVAQDPDVESLTLFTARGAVLAGHGELRSSVSTGIVSVAAPVTVRGADRIAVFSPVVALEGPRGALALELSTRRLSEQGRIVRRDAALAGLAALLLGIAGASFIAVSLGRRLRAIAGVAESVAGGNLDQKPLETGGPLDEIGSVAVAFNTMLEEIRSLVARIRATAQEEQERLARLVAQRTQELHERHADLKRVLDNVGQGFFTLDREGHMSRERSAVLESWFGPIPESAIFAEVLAEYSPRTGEAFAVGWELMNDRILTLELYLDQLPKGISARGRELELEYRPIFGEGGRLERVLVVVSDGTARVERERAEADEREVTRLFTRAFADRNGFLAFVNETKAQVASIARHAGEGEQTLLKRALHTLKGNAAIYGVETISTMCHTLEDTLAETDALRKDEVSGLQERWFALANKVEPLLVLRSDTLEIAQADYAELLAAVESGLPSSDIRELIRGWRMEPAETRLRRMAEQAMALGSRLNKPLDVQIESNRVRLPEEAFGEFWAAAVHVIRNAVDHGIETTEERRTLGKSVPAAVTLRTSTTPDGLTIEFSDTGRGIDWPAVARQARSLGLAAETHEELLEALFADGVTTRDLVSEFSGRGMGLGAVRHACQKLGGTVEVASVPGVGTTFRFIWPATVVASTSTPAPKRWERAS